MIVGTNLTKVVNGSTILHDVSVTVKPGKALAVIGPNGAGKTTLLRNLSLVDLPTSGSVEIDNTRYDFLGKSGTSPAPPWPHITVVFQQLFLWPHLTLRQNVLLPVSKRLDSSECEKVFQELIGLFQMDHVLDRYPNEASVGERQRVALMRAVVLKPQYLFLDEITSALDVEQIRHVLEYLIQLKKAGTGLLFVSHLLGFAQRLADEVIFLHEGTVIESGNASILTTPRTERMSQFVSLVEPTR